MTGIPHPRRSLARRVALLATGLALAAGLPAVLIAPAQAASAVVVKSDADTYVRSDQPDANFGTKYVLDVQASSASTPQQNSYIRFSVSGLTSAPASVQLRLYSYATSATGLQVWTASSTWTETGMTYNNAPAPGSTMVGAIPNISSNAWASLDVSKTVTGNGTYTFVITTTSTADKQLSSRETTATPPQLVIQPGGGTPAKISATSGSGQATGVGTAFSNPLVATVTDSSGTPVAGSTVTFTAPGTGASGTFTGGASSASVTTDSAGTATSPAFTANSVAGSYQVTAAVSGVSTPAAFALTNTTVSSTSSSSAPASSSSPPVSSSSLASSSSPPASSSSPPASSSSLASSSSSLASSSPISSPSSSASSTTTTFALSADSYVRSDQPDTNFGTKYNLAAEAGSSTTPTITSYLTVPVKGLTGSVTSATLQLYSYATSSLGVKVSSTASGWSETGITYNNAPPVGAVVGNGPNIVLDTWASIDLGSAITGNGTYSFAITTARTANNQFGSRESGTPPKLVVVTSSGTTSTPTATGSSSSTGTSSTPPSSSPTSSPTSSPSVTSVTAKGGAVQSAMVGSAFGAPLAALVVDASGNPVSGAPVTFTAPASGASATFPGGAPTITISTDSSGTATSPVPTANSTAGSYQVTATTPGAAQAAVFSLTNTDPTIVAAGDIACTQGTTPTATSCQQVATSNLAISLHPNFVLPLGDDQYDLGSLSDYQAMYDPSWGRLNSIAYPVPGNHEYGYIGTAVEPTGGTGYFTYFGNRSHPLQPGCTTLCTSWYSYNIGSWHVIALDSQCAVIGGCNPGNPEYNWLQSDLNANTAKCTLAYWHIPLYSSSQDHQPDMQSIYNLLYTKGADLILNGHAHFYERFAPQDAYGNADPTNGIPQFIVGSGGRSFFAINSTPAANSVARIANTFGVLQMTLSAGSYSWRFVAANGATASDSGTANCH